LIADVEKLLKILLKNTHTIPITNNRSDFTNPNGPSSNTSSLAWPSLEQKVSKACRIEGSKSSLFLIYFAFESLSYIRRDYHGFATKEMR
jgi:hypothetical protein